MTDSFRHSIDGVAIQKSTVFDSRHAFSSQDESASKMNEVEIWVLLLVERSHPSMLSFAFILKQDAT
jgi:hypothetical protein